MHKWIGSALVQIMACRLFGTKPLSKTIAGILSIETLGTNFSEILSKIQNFSFTKMHLNISSAKWQPFCLGTDELTTYTHNGMLLLTHCNSSWIELDWTRTTRTPAFWGYPPPPHDYPYHWVILDPKSKEDKVKVTNLKNSPKFQIFEFRNGHYTRHTFWSCLIRCANMKWIRWVLLKIQSGHDSVHRRTEGQTDRRTDGQGDTSISPLQLRWSGGYNNCRIYARIIDYRKWWDIIIYPCP